MKAEELKEILKDLNISQGKFARLSGASRQSVTDWIAGRKNMSKPYQKIALLLRDRPELVSVLEKYEDSI